jgi:hypothetical protein
MEMAGTTKFGGILMPAVRSALSDLNQIHYKGAPWEKAAAFLAQEAWKAMDVPNGEIKRQAGQVADWIAVSSS